MPGEVQIINANSRMPEQKLPESMPQQMTQLPQLMFDKQKELQGFTDARAGKPGAGISRLSCSIPWLFGRRVSPNCEDD